MFACVKNGEACAVSWFALRVRTRSELMVSGLLQAKGYHAYSPSYVVERQYCDRKKRVQEALFPGYVFCRFLPTDLLPVVSTPAVRNVVGFGSRPQPISDDEMERLRRGVQHGQDVAPCPYLHTGQRVRVRSGALAGIEGFLVQVRSKHRLVISADILQRAVWLEVAARQVVPV